MRPYETKVHHQITEEGQKQIRELGEKLKKFSRESNIKMLCAKSTVEVNL